MKNFTHLGEFYANLDEFLEQLSVVDVKTGKDYLQKDYIWEFKSPTGTTVMTKNDILNYLAQK